MDTFKSQGTTPSEKILSAICEETFLSLWSYPNLYRDQGRTTATADGKELCDLLVAFGNDILIFSDKSCAMGDSGELGLDWSRWFRKSVIESAEQIYGAERWLNQHPGKVFLDRACTVPLPISVPLLGECRIHRIVIATGARERCARELGTNGSLALNPATIGQKHVADFDRNGRIIETGDFRPFVVGQVNPAKGFVHVLDEQSLALVMRELDTARDLIAYLSAKEKLIISGKLAYAAGEEEILYEYFRNFDLMRGHYFETSANHPLVLNSDGWRDWENSPEWRREQKQNALSRLVWDRLINDFTSNVLSGRTLKGSIGDISEAERALRVMAGESRLARRDISRAFVERMGQSSQSRRMWRMLFSSENMSTGYVFLFYRHENGIDFEDYRLERKTWLTALSLCYGSENPHLKQIVGIATEPGFEVPTRTFELSFAQLKSGVNWRDTMAPEALRRLKIELGVRDEDINASAFVGVRHLPR